MKRASLLCLLLAGCVVDDTDPELSQNEAELIGDPDDDLPEEYPPQAPTSSFRLTDRAPDSIAMRWTTPANVTSTKVQRRVVGGSWTNVKSYGVTSGVLSYRNSGLAQDTRYCYRIAVYNADGAAFTPEKCALTEVPGSPSLSRVRLELRVADVSGAGTTDLVSVSLNDTAFGNFTGLDYSINDFARNSTFRYDLDMNGIPVLHDIANITIKKYGTDSLCLRSFRLLLDEVPAYSRTFGNTSTTCHLLNASGSSTFTVTHAQLRASSTFTSWQPPFPPQLVIPQEEIEERLEGIMGDLIWNSPHVQWGELDGSEYVEVAPVPGSPQELAVSYDLEGLVDNWFNPDIDVDLTLAVDVTGSGSSQQLSIETTDMQVDVDLDILAAVLLAIGNGVCGAASGETCQSMIEDYASEAAEKQFEGFSEQFDVDTGGVCDDVTVEVNGGGDLVFGCAD